MNFAMLSPTKATFYQMWVLLSINRLPYWCLSNNVNVIFSLLWLNMWLNPLKRNKDALLPTIWEVSLHGFMRLCIKIINFIFISICNIIDDHYGKVCLMPLLHPYSCNLLPHPKPWFSPLEYFTFNLLPVPEANYQYSIVVLPLVILKS